MYQKLIRSSQVLWNLKSNSHQIPNLYFWVQRSRRKYVWLLRWPVQCHHASLMIIEFMKPRPQVSRVPYFNALILSTCENNIIFVRVYSDRVNLFSIIVGSQHALDDSIFLSDVPKIHVPVVTDWNNYVLNNPSGIFDIGLVMEV